MTDRELLQKALDVIEEAQAYTSCETFSPSMTKECAITAEAIRTRLAQPESVTLEMWKNAAYSAMDLLIAQQATPKKEWVGLTGREIVDLFSDSETELQFARAIEEKLKEKNND